MNDFIQGDKFAALADNVKIFYTPTHMVNTFFKRMPTKEPFILISHNSDGCVEPVMTRNDSANVNLMPDNLIHWFSQNVNVVNERVESIPLGLENNKWLRRVDKIGKMRYKLSEEKKFKNLLYINHNVDTNYLKRNGIYELFAKKCNCWLTIEKGSNGNNFDSYIDNVYNHKFIICPEGNGIDTVRTWEALYMGSIPIEKRNINNQFYKELPILFVEDWEQVTEEFLIKEYQRIKGISWNYDLLTFNYWKNKIYGKR